MATPEFQWSWSLTSLFDVVVVPSGVTQAGGAAVGEGNKHLVGLSPYTAAGITVDDAHVVDEFAAGSFFQLPFGISRGWLVAGKSNGENKITLVRLRTGFHLILRRGYFCWKKLIRRRGAIFPVNFQNAVVEIGVAFRLARNRDVLNPSFGQRRAASVSGASFGTAMIRSHHVLRVEKVARATAHVDGPKHFFFGGFVTTLSRVLRENVLEGGAVFRRHRSTSQNAESECQEMNGETHVCSHGERDLMDLFSRAMQHTTKSARNTADRRSAASWEGLILSPVLINC